MDEIYTQAPKYLTVALNNMGLNGLSMYVLVSGFGLHYLVAQIITIAAISIESFIVYRYVIFTKP
jgi:putative flippase GtrA